MTTFSFMLPACILGLFLGGCQDSGPAEREWKDQLYKNLALIGARNWIVIAESSFPAYTGPGIKTMLSDKTSDEVLLDVLDMLEKEAHVVPRIMVNAEMRNVTEDYAPGIRRYRHNIDKMLPGRQHFELMSRTINSLIEDAAKQFNVLVIKTKTSLPYSNIYIELDSGYWNSESETFLRNKMEARDARNTAGRLPSADRALDVPLIPVKPGPPSAPNASAAPSSPNPGTKQSAPDNPPADDLPTLPKAPPSHPGSNKEPGAAPPPIKDPLAGKAAIARLS